MQQQFLQATLDMEFELKRVRRLDNTFPVLIIFQLEADVARVVSMRNGLSVPKGGHTLADLGRPDLWSIGDLYAFQQIVKNLERSTIPLKDKCIELKTQMADLQTKVLRGRIP